MSIRAHVVGSITTQGHPQVGREFLHQPATGEAHVVEFYEDDASLVEVVGDFLASGLNAGEPVVVIATPEHRDAFGQALAKRGLDVARATGSGQLVMLDTRETLALFMAGDMPDWARFRAAVGS